MWQRESVRALQMICTLGFLRKLSTIDAAITAMKYRVILKTVYYRRPILNTADPYRNLGIGKVLGLQSLDCW